MSILAAADALVATGILEGVKVAPSVEEWIPSFTFNYFVNKETKQVLTEQEFYACENKRDFKEREAKITIRDRVYISPETAAKRAYRGTQAESAVELAGVYQNDENFEHPIDCPLDSMAKFISDFPHHFEDLV